ncbi:hypothetical protein [Azospirillum sp. TSO35-2]|uniref:hypothetical protein n=1 Tax=Azospirillum sp. TSO35-2 TaxID=716796 RepID=UPI001305063A|nr:hypothetical protein [Azospirillum sp. TSO35-2]
MNRRQGHRIGPGVGSLRLAKAPDETLFDETPEETRSHPNRIAGRTLEEPLQTG